MKPPLISVVVPTYNRADVLAITLPAAMRQDLPSDAWELIVVVDGSTDGTTRLMQELGNPQLRVIEQSNRGLAAARNAGLRAARGELVLFLDDDMQCDSKVVRRHLQGHADRRVRIVEGAITLSSDSAAGFMSNWRHEMVEEHFAEIRARRDERWPWQAIRFANTSAPRKLLIEAGGFDERFRFAHEDLELGLRLSKTGADYIYVPDLAVSHIYRKRPTDFARDSISYGHKLLLLSRLHPEYRTYSWLAGIGNASWKGIARELAARFPLSPNMLWRPCLAVAEKLASRRSGRRTASKMLAYISGTGALRGALAEAGSWKALRSEFGMRLPVLMYHHVGPRLRGANPELRVSPARFAAQMNWLAHHKYTPIRLADWLAWCSEAKPLPRKPVLITFDDGFADLVEYAFPILRRYRYPAVIFVVTGLIGKTNEWDRKAGWSEQPLMSLDQMREAAGHGIEFGAHSRTHPDLTQISGEQLKEEIGGSAEDLRAIFGEAPLAFAYPYGLYNQSVCDAVRRSFQLAFTVDESLNSLADDPFLMKRIGLFPTDLSFNFAWLLNAGIHPVHQLRDRVRPRTRLRTLWRKLFPSLGMLSEPNAK